MKSCTENTVKGFDSVIGQSLLSDKSSPIVNFYRYYSGLENREYGRGNPLR
jgi:hypothetical protein